MSVRACPGGGGCPTVGGRQCGGGGFVRGGPPYSEVRSGAGAEFVAVRRRLEIRPLPVAVVLVTAGALTFMRYMTGEDCHGDARPTSIRGHLDEPERDADAERTGDLDPKRPPLSPSRHATTPNAAGASGKTPTRRSSRPPAPLGLSRRPGGRCHGLISTGESPPGWATALAASAGVGRAVAHPCGSSRPVTPKPGRMRQRHRVVAVLATRADRRGRRGGPA